MTDKKPPTPSPPAPAKKTRDIVQLGSNQADHQVGETFTKKDAEALDILKHCHPFKE